ncbi:secretin N-terminal domain-containing protein [Rhodocyclaceae bacterium SMB388]
MRHALHTLLGLCLLCWIGITQAQALEVIPLKHRTAEEVLPVLQPLVEPGGTLTGVNDRLFMIGSPRNRADIERALAALDTPPARLIIRVAQDRQTMEADRGAAARGQIVLGGSRQASGELRVWDTRNQRNTGATQMVQTIDGGRAFIQVGRSLPLPMREVVVGPGGAVISESIAYRDVGSGFHAEPRLRGDRVTVQISQQTEQATPRGRLPAIDSQRLTTTVEGALGEWIELGGTREEAFVQRGGSFSTGRSEQRENRSIWLKVERAEH